MAKRFKFVVVFEGDLDMIPGWGHSEVDWHRLATAAFLMQKHYNTEVTITETTDARNVLDGWTNMQDGWVEVEGFDMPSNLAEETDVQVKTEENPNGYTEWFPAGKVWTGHRPKVPSARVTHYRKRKPSQPQA